MEPLEGEQEQLWRQHERTGRSLGELAFLDRIEDTLRRIIPAHSLRLSHARGLLFLVVGPPKRT
jgi:hypothetical protein